ncbi:YlxR family protein [Frigoribacterium sp. CFBP 13729]|nr:MULTISPECIES: YlxR family protein [unclassified Frigoribacterium]MBD8584678.1 YlxR family protein [Frigoribacterium sp. CFBP 8766]MBD8609436.1 YlxR family protein [Frigoribacterium sp. CFBP 13729]
MRAPGRRRASVGGPVLCLTHPARFDPRGRLTGRDAGGGRCTTPFAPDVSRPPTRGGRVVPVRTCIGTRARAPRSSLVRVVARDGRLVVDETATLPGRGAWLTPSMDAFESAVKRRAFRRALRLDSEPDTEQLRDHLMRLQTDVHTPSSTTTTGHDRTG